MTRDSHEERPGGRAVPAGNRRGIRRWIAFAPVALLLASQLVLPAGAGDSGKVKRDKSRLAPDLVETLKKESPGKTARLVVKVNHQKKSKLKERVEELGGTIVGDFPWVDQMVLEMSLGDVEALTAADGIEYVAPDREVVGVASQLQITTGASLLYPPVPTDGKRPGKDEPAGLGFEGDGIGVAVIDSGIEPNRRDLDGKDRVVARVDFTGRKGHKDEYGHGTYLAGVIAGDGEASRRSGADFAGIAPGATLIDLKVLDENGRGRLSDVIAAIDFAVAYRAAFNIRVLNLSLAAPPIDSYRDDPLCHAVARAAQAGLVVVTAAGNFGLDARGEKVYGGISSPGNSPHAITVGAGDTRGTDARSDDTVAAFSSRGPTWSGSENPATGAMVRDSLPKPDVVAPGVNVVSLGRRGSTLLTMYPALLFDTKKAGEKDVYMTLSGTSVSSGVVSGAVALMLQANPSLTPNLVKAILMYTAQILEGPDLFEQGAGMINIEGAVRLARAMSPDAGLLPPGGALMVSGLPDPPGTTIAGEPVVWSQGLIWGRAWVGGHGLLGRNQTAYAQGLIWGIRRDVWGAGVIWSDGLYTDQQVVYGGRGEWLSPVWDTGQELENGVVFRASLSTSGVVWQNRLISDDFFRVESSSLIWGFVRQSQSQGLIWGINAMGLIWGAF